MKNKIKILVTLLLFILSKNSYALENETITVTVGDIDAPVFNINVSWDSMEFKYVEQKNYIWSEEDKSYILGESTYEWNTSNNSLNITNNSHCSVLINLNYKSLTESINGSFDISKYTMKSKETKKFKLTLDGNLTKNNTDYIKIGTIELAIF